MSLICIDFQIEKFINHLWSGTFVDKVTSFLVLVTFLLIFYLVIFVLAYYHDKKNGKMIVLSLILAFVIDLLITNLFIKYFLGNYFHLFRLQPWQAHPNDIIAIGKKFMASSFPSAHLSSILAVFTVFVYYWRKSWFLSLVFALLIAFSLMHNGVHYPTDILAGSGLGFLYGLAVIYLGKKLFARSILS